MMNGLELMKDLQSMNDLELSFIIFVCIIAFVAGGASIIYLIQDWRGKFDDDDDF